MNYKIITHKYSSKYAGLRKALKNKEKQKQHIIGFESRLALSKPLDFQGVFLFCVASCVASANTWSKCLSAFWVKTLL